jgi:hypothetical protein
MEKTSYLVKNEMLSLYIKATVVSQHVYTIKNAGWKKLEPTLNELIRLCMATFLLAYPTSRILTMTHTIQTTK